MTEMPNSNTHSWAKEIVEYYRQGYSDAEVAAAMGYTVRQFNEQLADNPTFSKLVEFGRTLSLAWWESQSRKNINNKSFNTPLWVFTMKNKYGWADKIETTNSNENTDLSIDQLRSEIGRKLKKLTDENTPGLTDAMRVLKPVEATEGINEASD